MTAGSGAGPQEPRRGLGQSPNGWSSEAGAGWRGGVSPARFLEGRQRPTTEGFVTLMKDIRIANLEDDVKRLSGAVMKAESERDRLEEARMTLAMQYGENERQLHRAIEKLKCRTKEAESNTERYRLDRYRLRAQLNLAMDVCTARRKSLAQLLSDARWLMERSGLSIPTKHAEEAIDLLPDHKLPGDKLPGSDALDGKLSGDKSADGKLSGDVTEVESA